MSEAMHATIRAEFDKAKDVAKTVREETERRAG